MKNDLKTLITALVLGLTFGFAGISLAWERPCAADIQAYCAGVPKGHGAIRKCLREHKDQISQGCKDAIKHKAKEHRAKKVGTKKIAAPEATTPPAAAE